MDLYFTIYHLQFCRHLFFILLQLQHIGDVKYGLIKQRFTINR